MRRPPSLESQAEAWAEIKAHGWRFYNFNTAHYEAMKIAREIDAAKRAVDRITKRRAVKP